MVAPMSVARDAVGVCVLGDRLFAVGGYDGQQYLTLVEAYDPIMNEWQQVGVTLLAIACFLLHFVTWILFSGGSSENWPSWTLCRCEQPIPGFLEGIVTTDSIT